MGKTTKKKKSKRLKRRIGLIAIGGLSMVLTVCLSVGATLAWFAGSTWASKDLFMGGPVYVEMAGRGQAGSEDNHPGTGYDANYASWKGGNGELDIIASSRSTGTAATDATPSNTLLPGQKLLVYSQARVYSTAYNADSIFNDSTNLESSGANVSNSNYTYTNAAGEKKTTTTSVLRARFSINVDFDPTVGFNNFTDANYANHYPVQSDDYTGQTDKTDETDGGVLGDASGAAWWLAFGATPYSQSSSTTAGRRDAITVYEDDDAQGDYKKEYIAETAVCTVDTDTNVASVTSVGAAGGDVSEYSVAAKWAIQQGVAKSIYKWKYVSSTQYNKAVDAVGAASPSYTYGIPMGEPFNGLFNTAGGDSAEVANGNGVGFYGVWECDSNGTPLESDSFYKSRTKEYLQSYQESYYDDYNRKLILNINNQMDNLEEALNKSFVKLVNESSDKIIDGYVHGFNATLDGTITYPEDGTGEGKPAKEATGASWLYVDPSIGEDTNAGDSATSRGGWWYLVACDTTKVSTGNNKVTRETDSVDPKTVTNWAGTTTNTITPDTTTGFTRTGTSANGYLTNSADRSILEAKLYQITPDRDGEEYYGTGSQVTKIVSRAFPFVNGMFELPGKEITNIFANAKITFQISFQALQAFFPWSPSIDGLPSGHQLAGLGKALNIKNAIPIYNEAFNYLAYLSA